MLQLSHFFASLPIILLILSTTGERNIQTGGATLLLIKFSIISSDLRRTSIGKFYWLLPEKENTASYSATLL